MMGNKVKKSRKNGERKKKEILKNHVKETKNHSKAERQKKNLKALTPPSFL